MRSYYYTGKLLIALGIVNLWMFIPSFYSVWWDFSLIRATQGNTTGQYTLWLLSTTWEFAILIFTTWAFFKRWYWVVVLYVLYLSHWISAYVSSLIQFWQQHDNLNFLGPAVFPCVTSSLTVH